MIDRQTLDKYWKGTEVIRAYQQMLFTFGDMQLPYLFAGEHRLRDRAVVISGFVVIQQPTIILPGYGPEFREGFEGNIPHDIPAVFRTMGFPYCYISNRPVYKQEVDYGTLQSVLDRHNQILEDKEDTETGLIKGIVEGTEVSLARYLFELTVKSAPGNIREIMEHLRRQRGKPIRPRENITDDEIARLFE